MGKVVNSASGSYFDDRSSVVLPNICLFDVIFFMIDALYAASIEGAFQEESVEILSTSKDMKLFASKSTYNNQLTLHLRFVCLSSCVKQLLMHFSYLGISTCLQRLMTESLRLGYGQRKVYSIPFFSALYWTLITFFSFVRFCFWNGGHKTISQ